MASTTSGSQDDLRAGQQKPMLASQRAKLEQTGPSEANRTGKVGGYFTLGYKEGFQQWVRTLQNVLSSNLLNMKLVD